MSVLHRKTPSSQLGSTKQRKWRCDVCDLTLESEVAKRNHLRSHVKCTECSFEGAPKVVKGHFQSVHGKFSRSGFKSVTIAIPGCRVQKFRICVGNRPEDVAKWIAERRRRFPRQRSVQESTETHIGLVGTELHNVNSTQNSGLTSLLAGYGSSSDENDGDNDNAATKDETLEDEAPGENGATMFDRLSESTSQPGNMDDDGHPKRSKRPCRFFIMNGICRNGDACRFAHDVSTSSSAWRHRQNVRHSNTLLRRLLVNDIRRETTLALQLLKHVAKSNYFLVDKKT